MLSVGIVGATGYTGIQCVNLCLNHPKCNIKKLYAHTNAGQATETVFSDCSNLPPFFEKFDPTSDLSELDVLFLAIPHATSHHYMESLVRKDLKIIDISADFRLNSAALFKTYYDVDHMSPALLETIPYGLPELYFNNIQQSSIVANPGCYSTAIILALHPLKSLSLPISNVVIDAKTGVSGAGKVLKPNFLFCEVNDVVSAYGTGFHRHQAEMEEQLGFPILFSPHLLPMSRGILASIYVTFEDAIDSSTVFDAYHDFYDQAPFTSVSTSADISTKSVLGTNNCLIRFKEVENKKQLVIFSMIDNLLKGAAGQAIQNMNIMCGFEQDLGLPKLGPMV